MARSLASSYSKTPLACKRFAWFPRRKHWVAIRPNTASPMPNANQTGTGCQRAVKTSQVGKMKSSHFERSEMRRRGSSTSPLLTETVYCERTQDGDCRVDSSITSVTLVSAADCARAARRSRHSAEVPQAVGFCFKTRHSARRLGDLKTRHFPPDPGY